MKWFSLSAAACAALVGCDPKTDGATGAAPRPSTTITAASVQELTAAPSTIPAVAAPTPSTPTATPGKYPQASTRVLEEAEISKLTCDEQHLMKNEIYARHGYRFKTKSLAEQFAKEDWYKASSDNVESSLSKAESTNVALMSRLYATLGCKSRPSAAGAVAKKCGPGKHFDALDKVCRDLGDCPKGYHWNEPMQTCIDDGE